MITYAQNFEDVMLARVFGDRKDGFYVDVGAGDPKRLSVTKWFYDQGWCGINIEPNRELFQALSSARPRDINLDCGVGECPGVAEFAEMSAGERSSFDPEAQAVAIASGCQVTRRTVQITTLNAVLAEHASGKAIDFLKIDVEGWERRVLMGLDLRRFRPTVIVIEATEPGTRIESSTAWEELPVQAGYTCVWFDGLNRFYLANEKIELRAKFSEPPNVFDDFEDWRLRDVREALANTQIRLDRIQGVLDRHTGRQAASCWSADRRPDANGLEEAVGSGGALGAAHYAASILASRSKTAKHFLKLMSRKVRNQ